MIQRNGCVVFDSSGFGEGNANENETAPPETGGPSEVNSSGDCNLGDDTSNENEEGAEAVLMPSSFQIVPIPAARNQERQLTTADYHRDARERDFNAQIEREAGELLFLMREIPERTVRRAHHMSQGLLSVGAIVVIFLAMVFLYPICNNGRIVRSNSTETSGEISNDCTRVLLFSLFSLLAIFSVAQIVLLRSRRSRIRRINRTSRNTLDDYDVINDFPV
ncbi:hypothetical protein [Candidatus Ichthyocystis hellenicum]|uniref:hypothetical protein n=1 Tax=Candidatus Ichthyocystis hellenicum TaxID=1561003 RepID=UPI000B817471|nr:hypothetical protein [Candidatus Ichthyocystis hellenicum]